MGEPILSREQTARHLAVTTRRLIRYEAWGLVRVARDGDVEGYPPDEISRLWSIVTLQRDLRINLAGVEAVLKLRDQMRDFQSRWDAVTRELEKALDERSGDDANA